MAEQWLPRTLKEEAWLAQDEQRERPSVREATFSAPRFSPGRPSAQETDHSKALTTLIWAKGREASPVQTTCKVRSCDPKAPSMGLLAVPWWLAGAEALQSAEPVSRLAGCIRTLCWPAPHLPWPAGGHTSPR